MRKNHFIKVYLTQKELDSVRQNAQDKGFAYMSEFVRTRILCNDLIFQMLDKIYHEVKNGE